MDKMFGLAECKAADDKERIIEFVATHEIEDYDHDIVKVDGVDISKIKKNKSFLWSHSQHEHPVGKIISIKKDGKKIIGKAQMTSEEENPFGYRTWKLIKGGYINNVSMSFIPDRKTIEYKDKDGRSVRIIHNSTMLEVSAVNIGANRNATITSKSLKEAFEKAWDDGILDGTELNDMNEAIEKMETAELRMDELVKAGVALSDKDAQTAKIREMEDEEFGSYKEELVALKGAVEAELENIDLKAKVAALELQVKEQELDEELEDSIYTQVYDEFVGSSSQENPEHIDEHTDTLTIEDLPNLLKEDE